jgi:hypothetical protein
MWSPYNSKNASNFIISFLFVSCQHWVLDLDFRLGMFSKFFVHTNLFVWVLFLQFLVFRTQNIAGSDRGLLNQLLCQACQWMENVVAQKPNLPICHAAFYMLLHHSWYSFFLLLLFILYSRWSRYRLETIACRMCQRETYQN